MKNRSFFNSHLIDTNTTYSKHMKRAFSFSARSLLASVAFFIHSIFPFIFKSLGSDTIKSIDVDIKNFDGTANRDIRCGAVAIVLNENDKALVLKRSDRVATFRGFWNFPAGGVDEGEEPIQAAARECFEESGVKISESEMVFVTSFKDHKLDVDIHYFLTKTYSGEPLINWESTEFAWVSLSDISTESFVPIPKDLFQLIKEKSLNL